MSPEQNLRLRLKKAGFDEAALTAVWPAWWSDEAATSPSAQAELRFAVARRLGLNPRLLLERNEPRFVWRGESKYKHLGDVTEWERDALSSFGICVGTALTSANPAIGSLVGASPLELRQMLMKNRAFIGLGNLLSLCWSIGLPVIQLRVFPTKRKRMSAMCVQTAKGFAVLVGKDSQYPAPIAFYLAHELGHIALGHLGSGAALLDVEDRLTAKGEQDEEEDAADRFALELLTGFPKPKIEPSIAEFNAAELAESVLRMGPEYGVEPGLLALCCGFSTGRWPSTNASLKFIYGEPKPVWKELNGLAHRQLDWESVSPSSASFLLAAMGMRE